MTERHALLLRTLQFLRGLAGSPIPAKLFDEYQALSADLAAYLASSEMDDKIEEETHGEAA